jgi:Flp pilus assembly protein TadB
MNAAKTLHQHAHADTTAAHPKNRRRGERARGALYYAMPWNLKREINALGYGFSAGRIALIYAAIAAIMVTAGIAFKLPPAWILPLILAGLWFAPALVRNTYKNRYERQRFADVNVYIEQMLYAVKNSQKILTALEDVRVLFPRGSAMREAIDQAISVITDPTSPTRHGNAEERALAAIEERYPNDYVKSLHRFMLKVEAIGGDFDSSISLLLDNRAMWETRVYKLQDQRRQKRSQILGSVIASLLLCLVMLYILPAQADISGMLPVRIANVAMIVVFTRIYLAADTKLSSDLLRSKSYQDDEKLLRDYERYLAYDPRKGLRASLLYATLPALLIAAGLLIAHNTWVIAAGAVLLPLALAQHSLGHRLLGKRLHREISVAFPQWLMELALLLQSEGSVQTAIFATIDTALPVLRPELSKLRDRLIADPASPDPFLRFFEDFHMPEITTSMQMLYSLSIGSGGDADEQIPNIVKRNNTILDRAEEMRNDASLSGLYTLFLLPVLLGGVVLMVDMTAFLLSFMSNLGI